MKDLNDLKKEFQVWKNYGSEGWGVEEFNTFEECVDYIGSCASGVEMRITKLVGEQIYNSSKKIINFNK